MMPCSWMSATASYTARMSGGSCVDDARVTWLTTCSEGGAGAAARGEGCLPESLERKRQPPLT